MVRVKICGVTQEDDVSLAVEAGADAVGFISGFPQSPRNVSLTRAGQLVRTVPPFVDSVLVTRSEVLERHRKEVADIAPSVLQLYGRVKDPATLKSDLRVKLILPRLMKGGGNGTGDVSGYDAVLSDTYVKGTFGGTGMVSDWDLCKRFKDRISPTPFILSGGLNPGNVEDAISKVRPFAVDVSSGVEASPGVKDGSKMMAFVSRAKEL